MSSSINTTLLRTLTLDELLSELSSHRLRLPDDTITEQLLSAVECGSISTSVFAAWFGVCKSPSVIRQSLKQKVSIHIRSLGIKQLKSGLNSTRWEKLWNGLGGTAGLLEVFSDLSVSQVKAACTAVGRCAKDGDSINKRARVTELFKGLHPNIFTDVAAKTNDLRPLTKFYQALIPSCTTELVDWVTSKEQEGRWLHVSERKLLEHHSDSIGRAAYHAVFKEQSSDIKSKDRLAQLSRRWPSSTYPETRFSASMAFALSLLHNLVKTRVQHVEDEWVVSNLIRPLLRRAVRKKASWSSTQEITLVIIAFLKQHPSAAKLITHSKGDVLHLVALCWSRRSTLFEAQLTYLLGIVFGSRTTLKDISSLLVGVPKSRRYALLRLSCQEVMGVNLDSEQDLAKARGSLTSNILDNLEAPQALGLFKRLRNARGDVGLVDLGLYSSVLATKRTPSVREGDPDIYYLVLLNRNRLYKEAESYAANVLEVRKKTTRTTSDRETRTEYALSAWACASASGSLKLLSETVKWARSFIPDQLTASKLFRTYHDETYRLLSGFLACGNENLTTQDLRRRVQHANAVMTDLMDIACSALREPFFQSSDWQKTINIVTQGIKERIEVSAHIEGKMEASGGDMYHALWEDTIIMLLQMERLVNQEEVEKLGASTILGIVSWESVFWGKKKPKTLSAETWMFLDNLAKARNAMWTDLRPARYPDVLTLPEPFPRGLPVQHLLACWASEIANLSELAPYFFSRVRAALFVNPEAALKPVLTNKITEQAIGAFVDNYQYALKVYIPDVCEDQEKEDRLREVLNYAIGPLSAQRMDTEEASRYWKQFVPSHLQPALSKIWPQKRRIQWPVLPRFDDPSQTQEWDPLEGRPADVNIKARKLGKATYIDFSTIGQHAQLTRRDIKAHFKPPNPQVPAKTGSAEPIWSQNRAKSSNEARLLAGLLYLDAKYATTERLLTEPFPSSKDVRYPCLYLDENFLSSNDLRVSNAASYIATNIQDSPLPLVHKIATTLVGRFSIGQNPQSLEGAAFTLLQALSASDRPGLAFDLALKVIMDQPSTSSWHRMLFNIGFLQRIPASDARRFISTYAEAIGRKLDARKVGESDRAEAKRDEKLDSEDNLTRQRQSASQPNQPFIKVTTLKSLAQMLHGSTYIGDDASLEILSDLAQRVTHIDVRVSILKTLLSKLNTNRPELWDRILTALEAFIPLAGSLDERTPMAQAPPNRGESAGRNRQKSKTFRELDAEMAEYFARADFSNDATLSDSTLDDATPKVPKICVTTRSTWQVESPMLAAIFNHYIELDGIQLPSLYFERIVVPLVDALEKNTTKWTTLFLRKYAADDVSVLNTTLPPIPKSIQSLDVIFSRSGTAPRVIPQTLLDKYVAYMIFRIDPPAPIRRLNKSFEENPALRSVPEVEAWLEVYGTEVTHSWSEVLQFYDISNFDIEGPDNNGAHITPRSYQKAFLDIFTKLLWTDDPLYPELLTFTSALTDVSNLDAPWWDEYGRTTIEAMIAYIDSIRTREWERDPGRSPVVLPDTFVWRLMLLSYPLNSLSDEEEALENKCKAFAQQLVALLDEISGSHYRIKCEQIEHHLRRCLDFQMLNGLLLSALYLGDISNTRLSWLTTSELLRVDLASNIISWCRGRGVELLEARTRALLDTWVSSENEEVRRRGYRLGGQLPDTNSEHSHDT